jgi:hypothetical protein
MKRSSQVALTLLVPSMAAFGCSTEPASIPSGIGSATGGAGVSQLSDSEYLVSEDLDESGNPIPSSSPASSTQTGATQNTPHYRGRSSFIPYIPYFGGGRGWGGGYRPTAPSPPMTRPMGPNSSAPRPVGTQSGGSPGTVHSGSTGTVHTGSTGTVHGGFGGTGSHLSGGG